MNASDDKAQFAWQPLTMRGVAAFGQATLGRLLLVQLMVALLAAGTVVWFVHRCWFPTISEAIRELPAQGEIRSGRLEWSEPSPVCLAEGRFLALVVDLDHAGEARTPAHVQVEFGRADLEVYSLLGYVQSDYPRSLAVACNRTELGPWWGAWAPAILAIMAGLVVAGLIVSWAFLATVYCLPVWVIGFFADRECSLDASWRLAGAALMPGALLMCAVIVLYGWGALDLVRLALAAAAHLAVGWVYLLFSPLCLPRHMAAEEKANPFA
jgi:hypothetical protein